MEERREKLLSKHPLQVVMTLKCKGETLCEFIVYGEGGFYVWGRGDYGINAGSQGTKL